MQGGRGKIAITCGDPSGVGPEVIASWLKENPKEINDLCLIGPVCWIKELERETGILGTGIGPIDFKIKPGIPTEMTAQLAFEALKLAANGCKEGNFRAAVTGPVSKYGLRQVGFNYPGQTEFFAANWGGEPTMAFCGDKLKLVLVTWHTRLREIYRYLTPKRITRAVEQAVFLCQRCGVKSPKIGVCGINPHAGEKGLIGEEECKFIDPLLEKLQKAHLGLSLCQPADTIFWRALKGEFDVIVAMYHDQGLGPLKTLEFDSAVNITLGLSWIRTSPDHGTVFDIAGKGIASNRSFGNAITIARKLINLN